VREGGRKIAQEKAPRTVDWPAGKRRERKNVPSAWPGRNKKGKRTYGPE